VRARLVLDEAQREIEAQPVAAVSVVRDSHVFPALEWILRSLKFGKNFPNLEMTFKGSRRKISRANREE
jgi:hypothetical protein